MTAPPIVLARSNTGGGRKTNEREPKPSPLSFTLHSCSASRTRCNTAPLTAIYRRAALLRISHLLGAQRLSRTHDLALPLHSPLLRLAEELLATGKRRHRLHDTATCKDRKLLAILTQDGDLSADHRVEGSLGMQAGQSLL